MTIRADLVIPAEEFALPSVFEVFPDVTVEVEAAVGHPFGPAPHVWVLGDYPRMDERMRRDRTTVSVDVLGDGDSERLYGVEWARPVRECLATFCREEATVVSLVGRGGTWQFDVRCCGRDLLASLESALDAAGYSVTVDRIRTTDDRGAGSLLTDKQRIALVAAVRDGYYDVPRNVTMSDLAGDLDISQQALSKRLRRAHASLATRYLADPAPTPYQ